jgi:hypothetical protein
LRHSNTSPLVMLNASFAARKTEGFTLLAADCRVDT